MAPARASSRESPRSTRRRPAASSRPVRAAADLRRSRARCAERRCVARAAARHRREALDRRGAASPPTSARPRSRSHRAPPGTARGERYRDGAARSDELRSRVDPLRDQPRGAVPHRRQPPGHARVELADRRDERRSAHRPRRQRDLRARGASRRAAHPSRCDPRPARPRRHAGRRCAGRSTRQGSSWILGLRLDDAHLPVPYLIDPIALIAACGLAAGPGGTTSCTAATSTGSSSLGITKPSAAVAGDVMVAQVTVRSTGAITAPSGWNQIGTTAQDDDGSDRAGGLLASRRRHRDDADHVHVGGRQRRRVRRHRHVQGRRPVQRHRPGRARSRR